MSSPTRNPSDSRTNGEPPRSSRGEQTKARILRVAIQEFAARGLAGARVDVIARKARVNKQLVYYYFKNKDELYAAASRHILGLSRPHLDEPENPLDYWLRIVRYHRTRASAPLRRLLVWEALGYRSGKIPREVERRASWQGLADEVKAWQDAGELDPDLDPQMLALSVWGLTLMPVLLPQITRLATGLQPEDPAFHKAQERMIAQIMEHLRPQPRKAR